MYIRTETNDRIDSYEYKIPYVIPHSPSTWDLCINSKEDDKICVIATFTSVAQANGALKSLNTCIKDEDEVGWDAKEYLESLNDADDAE